MKDFIVRQGDEMLNFLIKKFDMINVYLNEGNYIAVSTK